MIFSELPQISSIELRERPSETAIPADIPPFLLIPQEGHPVPSFGLLSPVGAAEGIELEAITSAASSSAGYEVKTTDPLSEQGARYR
jgi:hypothetical protein